MKKRLLIPFLFKHITATSDEESFTHAAKLSYAFFGTLFYYLFKICLFILSPFLYVLGFLWRQLVIKPYVLVAHVAHLLYPVTLFCLAAVFCGAVIGGFAGFAAEACSSLIISATWGPEAVQRKKKKKEKVINSVETDEEEEEEEEKEKEEEEEYNLFHPFEEEQGTTSKGKEPMRPRMESWRNSFTSSSSSSSPGLIHRMKMSSTTKRKDSWEWEDDDFGGTTITKKPLL